LVDNDAYYCVFGWKWYCLFQMGYVLVSVFLLKFIYI